MKFKFESSVFCCRMLLALVLGSGFFIFNVPVCWGQVLNEDFKLLPSDGAASDDFGWSIAIDNGIVAVGARLDDDNGDNSGSAYLFDATTGQQLRKLLPSDGAAWERFGNSIAIANGVVAVGADGSAYLFNANTGQQIHKLLPSDGAASFGVSIAIDNGVVAVGADHDEDSGSAYLFDATTGQQLRKLLPSDGHSNDFFGYSIAIDNGIVAVGAWGDDDNGDNSGSAYLFDATTGEQLRKLLPTDGVAGDNFGLSIAIDNGVVAVGADRDDEHGDNSGSAYLFDASTGQQLHKLFPDDGAEDYRFGNSIAIANGVVAVGSWRDYDNGPDSGSAYLFDATTGQQLYKLLASDGVADDLFGFSIGIANGVVAVGAWLDDDNGNESGSAYIFDVSGSEVVIANQYTVFRGFHISGELSDSFASDDLYLKFNPGMTINSAEPPVWIEFAGTLPSDSPTSLSITLEANASTVGLVQTVEMFNYNSGQYQQVDAQAASQNNDSVVIVDISADIADYVETGTGAVKTRTGWRATGPILNFPWTICIDQVVWTVTE